MALSAVSALIAFVLIFSAKSSYVNPDRGDMVAILLAVPGAVAGWSGFDRAEGTIGGTLISRVSSSITLLLCIVSAAQFIIGGTQSGITGWISADEVWLALLTLALLNALVMGYAWYKRARLYNIVLEKDGLE